MSTIISRIEKHALAQGDQTAYIFLRDAKVMNASLSFYELHQRVFQLSLFLQKKYKKGDRALLLYPAGLDFICAFLACLCSGVIAIPAPPPDKMRIKRTLPRLKNIIQDSNAELILSTSDLLSNIKDIKTQLVDENSVEWLETDNIEVNLPVATDVLPKRYHDIAYLQYTSGSTSAPKGVMISHKNLMAQLSALLKTNNYSEGSKNITWMPYFHDYGLVEGLLQPLYNGTVCYVISPLAFIKRPIRLLKAISKYRITHTQGSNFSYHLCVQRCQVEALKELDLSHWQLASNGAEPINPKVMHDFYQLCSPYGFQWRAFSPSYGLAEATLYVAALGGLKEPVFFKVQEEALAQNYLIEDDSDDAVSLVSCGQVLEGMDVAIVDPNTLILCEKDRIGEIWVRGESIAQGYWNHSEASQETFYATLNQDSHDNKKKEMSLWRKAKDKLNQLKVTNEKYYLRTGDLGFIKEGELFITGRLKDMIIIHGQNYYPQDIEWTVENAHPILRANNGAAIAIEKDKFEKLAIIQEVKSRVDLDGYTIVKKINEVLYDEYDLTAQTIVLIKRGSISRTSSGKIQRQACYKFLENKDSPEILFFWDTDKERILKKGQIVFPQNELEFQLNYLWEEAFGISPISTTESFFELGGDSLLAGALLNKIESLFGKKIPLTTLFQAPSIKALAALLLDSEQSLNERSLVGIKTNGKKTPFFYVHGRSGSVLFFSNLARYIDVDRPFYGLQAVGLDGKAEPLDNIKKMAGHYINEIRSVQRAGPYLLGGRCGGGTIAYEMAQQLREMGEEVALLVVVEGALSPPIMQKLSTVQVQRLNAMVDELEQRKANIIYKVMTHFDQAKRAYRYEPYEGRALYLASERSMHKPDKGFGWGHYVKGKLFVEVTPGDHFSLDREPNVKTLAGVLNAHLAQAEAE